MITKKKKTHKNTKEKKLSLSKGFAIGESHDIIKYSIIINLKKKKERNSFNYKDEKVSSAKKTGVYICVCDLDWAQMWHLPSNNSS